jgi:hypothetical protein
MSAIGSSPALDQTSLALVKLPAFDPIRTLGAALVAMHTTEDLMGEHQPASLKFG